jgi:hypothetical protein
MQQLTIEEWAIYNSILQMFPNTSHETALEAALQGGVEFNFIHS